MCKVHEAAWWARHAEALKRQAEAQGYAPKPAAPVDNSDLI